MVSVFVFVVRFMLVVVLVVWLVVVGSVVLCFGGGCG